jgi:hypothetical protein
MNQDPVAELFVKLKAHNSDVFQCLPGYDYPTFCLLGYRQSRPTLMVKAGCDVPDLDSSDAVEVSIERPVPGKTFLYLSVTSASYEELFFKFCGDLLSVMEGAESEAFALSRLAKRYETWKAFWKSPRQQMTEEKVRGLAGELIYLLSCLDRGMEPGEVLQAWVGPDGGDQDFVFSNAWAEVKTVRQSASEVQISSLEQLVNPKVMADAGDVQGRLAVIRLHSRPAGSDTITLPGLYRRILERLKNWPHAQLNFINSVELAGADIKNGTHENKLHFELLEFALYDVNKEGFPRLMRDSNLPAGITKAKYSLSIPALEPWRISETEDEQQV